MKVKSANNPCGRLKSTRRLTIKKTYVLWKVIENRYYLSCIQKEEKAALPPVGIDKIIGTLQWISWKPRDNTATFTFVESRRLIDGHCVTFDDRDVYTVYCVHNIYAFTFENWKGSLNTCETQLLLEWNVFIGMSTHQQLH